MRALILIAALVLILAPSAGSALARVRTEQVLTWRRARFARARSMPCKRAASCRTKPATRWKRKPIANRRIRKRIAIRKRLSRAERAVGFIPTVFSPSA